MKTPEPRARVTAPVGLISGTQQIVTLLRSADFRVIRYGNVASACAADDAATLGAIVLHVEEAGPALTRAVESLKAQLLGPLLATCARIERWEVRAALAAGAAGVVTEDGLERALVPSLHATIAGQVCVPRSQWRQIEPPALSAREKQVLGLVVMGYMNGQIAEQLFLAESTVKSHLSSAFGKLGVRSRNEAVELILDPERGLGMGILGLSGERLDAPVATM
jgi:DNA-binding NarL/FixJ family response regulator